MGTQINLDGKNAIVTGASVGIGREIARTFAQVGASVAVNYRSGDEAALRLISEITASGGKAVAIKGDASMAVEVAQIIAAAGDALGGPIDIAVANLGP